MSEPLSDRERQERIVAAVLKVLGVALAIGLVVGLGTWAVVKALGLDSTQVVSLGPGPVQPRDSLPTTALPEPSRSDQPAPAPSPTLTNTVPDGVTDLVLSASPSTAGPMERINLTGQWPGHDAVSLLVQRYEDGAWVDFGVQVQVRVGSYATYVMTGREGENRFRVFDPNSDTASNEVAVTIG